MAQRTVSILFLLLPIVFLPYHGFKNLQLGKELVLISLAGAGLAFWVFRGTISREIRWRTHRFHLFLGAFLAWGAVTLIFAPNFSLGFFHLALLGASASVYWIVFNTAGRHEDLRTTLTCFAASAGIVSLIGILQHAGIFWERILDHYDEPMTTSTFDHANHAAQMIVLTLPLTGALGAVSRGYRRHLFTLAFVLQAVFLLLTRSRAAWLVSLFTLSAGAVYLLRPWKRKVLPALLLLLALGSGAFLAGRHVPFVQRTLTHFATIFRPGYEPNRVRLLVWTDTVKLIREHPLRGSGPGNFPVAFPRFQGDRLSRQIAELDQMVESPHNEYLRALAETGIIGFVLLGSGLLILLVPFLRPRRLPALSPDGETLRFGFLLALSALLLDSLFDHPLTKPVPLASAGLILAGCASLTSPGERYRSFPLPGEFRRALLALITITLIGTGSVLLFRWIASDYYRAQARHLFPRSPDRALRAIETSLSLQPGSYLSHFLYGNYLASLGESRSDRSLLTLSVPEYERTLDLFPTFHPAFLNQGTVLLKLGLPLEAQAAFERVREIQPYQPRANFYLGTILAGLGRKEEARALFKLAISVRPQTKQDIRDDPRLRTLFPELSGLQSEQNR